MKKLLSLLTVLMVLLSSFAAAEVAMPAQESSINAKIKVEEIKLNEEEITLQKGKTFKLKATILPKNASNKKVIWETSDKKVATVDKKGKVKAKGNGTCEITCSAKDGSGVIAVCVITVGKTISLKDAVYIGNNATMVFHKKNCRMVKRMLDINKVPFLTRDEPKKLGYKACGICKP